MTHDTSIPERLASALADRYRIERELGAGGMATVYLAQDVKHDRRVAIKVLRPELAAVIGAERFLAEIKTTANLQHPHILVLHDSGTVDGTVFYVMPYVEGESLRDRIAREKQLPVADAIRIATEIAGALDYAHRHGVIHRDIKPENILLHDKQSLVADFGIALAASRTDGSTRMTETGMSLGTPQYMSPEQAMGERTLDARTDIYALGCVVYEMLTGEPPFSGPTAQSIVAKVMNSAPQPITALRKTVPVHVAATIERALEKLPADRWESAVAFAESLANPAATSASGAAAAGVQRASSTTRATRALTAGVGVLALMAGVFIGSRDRNAGGAASTGVVQASLEFGDSVVVRAITNLRLAISPKGDRVVFVGQSGTSTDLWVRDLDQTAARKLPDTKGAFAPFFSPDGETVGFFSAETGTTALKTTPAAGGITRTILPDSVASYGGGDWGDDGNIYFTNANRGLSRIAASGGPVVVVTRVDSATGAKEYDYPDVLPGSRQALVMVWKGAISANNVATIDLETGAVSELAAGSIARYAAGFLHIGTSDGKILAARMDPKSGRVQETPVLVAQGVQTETSNGTVQFAVSEAGTLVFQRVLGVGGTLVWVDRSGRRTLVDTTITDVTSSVAISPDGTQIAVSRAVGGDVQLWIKQFGTGALTRISFDVMGADRPAWTPDKRIAYLANRDDRRTAWVQRADGSDSAKPVFANKMPLDEIWFDLQGRYTLGRSEGTAAGTRQIVAAKTGVDSAPHSIVKSRYDNYALSLSPNGNWLAHVSNESGAPEVYVRPFPSVDSARYTISVGGGVEPLWKRDGSELFFRNSRGDMYAVPVAPGKQFQHGPPRLIFAANGLAMQEYYRGYDVHPDGNRFLMVTTGGIDAKTLDVVFNWRAELEKLKR